MEVGDGLPSSTPIRLEKSYSIWRKSSVKQSRNLAAGFHYVGSVLFGDVEQIGAMHFRNNEHVSWDRRIEVEERVRAFVLEHFVRMGVACDDPAEDASVHVLELMYLSSNASTQAHAAGSPQDFEAR